MDLLIFFGLLAVLVGAWWARVLAIYRRQVGGK